MSIDIDYQVRSDYTAIDPPKFVSILNLYNLILIPINDKNNALCNFSISDEIKIYNKNTNKYYYQKVVLSCGYIKLSNTEYYYFYIGNGISSPPDQLVLQHNGQNYDMSTSLDQSANIKLLKGLLVLSDNFSYMFNTNDQAIINISDKQSLVKITKIENKYNFYKANTNSTILHILDESNFNLLYNINNPYSTNVLIRPLCYLNSPLGGFKISIKDDIGVSNDEFKYKIFINNKGYFINNVLDIKNLAGGSYSIKIIDKIGLIQIGNLNGQLVNSDSFKINIPTVKDEYKILEHKLPHLHKRLEPNTGQSNVMINLPYNKPFEIFGPNNFYRQYKYGHQAIYNVSGGEYIVKSENMTKNFFIIKNTNNYISSLS